MAQKEFKFNVRRSFMPLLRQMLHFVEQQLTAMPVNMERHLFEAKVILTELLTNAIKHSGAGQSTLLICITNQNINIVKKDAGRPLALLSHPELAAADASLQLANDVMHSLYASVNAVKTINFTCTEHHLPQFIDVSSVNEHFGLLIITKAADNFYYYYDEEAGINVFSVNKLLYAKA